MTVRACLASDLPVNGAPWLVPDADLADDAHSVVEERSGHVVAAGLRRRFRTTNAFDGVELYCQEGHGTEVLRALAAEDEDRSMVLRVVPGTATAAAVAELRGTEVIQSVPAGAIPTGHPDVLAWAQARLQEAEQSGVELRAGMAYSAEELLDLWMDAYLRMHESWAPVADPDGTREVFRGMLAGTLDVERTVVGCVDGRPVAATFLNAFDGALVPLMIEIQPGHRAGAAAAAGSMAAALRAVSPRPVEFEGHVDELLYMEILRTIPHRSAGVLTPMHMVRIDPARREGGHPS